jgi:molybdopterin converting factor small subunit
MSAQNGPQVLVRYFAAAAEAASREEELLSLTPRDTAGLRAELVARYGEPMTRVLKNCTLLVDGVAATKEPVTIHAGVDVLPPFAGG